MVMMMKNDLEYGVEELVMEGYLSDLENDMSCKVETKDSEKWKYPRDVAMQRCQLLCLDYLRFVMGPFWRSVMPESSENKKNLKKTTVLSQNLDAAVKFTEKVGGYLECLTRRGKERETAPSV